MSIKDQYLGFLRSKPLLQVESLLEIPQFNFEELSKLPFEINTTKINIRDKEVLGKRIEHFFEHSIINSKQYDLVCKNIQVFKNKITIGELDFIVKDRIQEKIIHIELIYKFYIYDPEISMELDRWIGPNRKDSLLRKIEKLKNNQFPLLHKEETLPLLKKLKLKPQEIEQEVCYLGNLFVPISQGMDKSLYLDNDCVVGYWLKQNEFTSKEYGTYTFYIPMKKNWVVHPESNKIWFSYEDIKKPLQEHLLQKKSPLVWVKKSEDLYERFFVVWW